MDVPFSVPFLHRLRFTRDVFHPDNPTFVDALAPPPVVPRAPARIAVFIDDGVVAAWPDLAKQIHAYVDAHRATIALAGPLMPVTGGEGCKNDHRAVDAVVQHVHDHRIDRQSYIVAIGGGAVLDAVGFAAGTAHRGVRLVRLPTTTLSQDDSGVGVKNGVNLFGKKNFLGTFSVPWAVLNDERFLTSLSDRDWLAGFSEAVKVAVVKDPSFFHLIAASANRIRARTSSAVGPGVADHDGGLTAARPIIERSAFLHLRHITSGGDPFELTEARPLDFGHWAAHKLEQMTNFRLRHGEAVSIGIAIDTLYSVRAGLLDPGAADTLLGCLAALGLPVTDEALHDSGTLLGGLEEFREHLGGRLTITLLQGIGRPHDAHTIDPSLMTAAISDLAGRVERAQATPD